MAYVGNLFLLALAVIWMRILIQVLRDKYASSVYLIWYLFSLASFLTGLVLWWSLRSGAIDQRGVGVSSWGKLVMQAIVMSANPMEEFEWLLALVGLIVVPQLASYLLSGLSGCAVRPRFVSLCVNFLSLSLAKAFSIASGVLLGIAVLGAFHRWQGVDAAKVMQYVWMTAMVLAFSFFALTSKTALDEWPVVANHPRMLRFCGMLVKLDCFMTRHARVSDSELKPGVSNPRVSNG
jgi:hypothetical protein